MRCARKRLLVGRQVALLQDLVREQRDQLRVGVIQRRVEYRLRHVQHPGRVDKRRLLCKGHRQLLMATVSQKARSFYT